MKSYPCICCDSKAIGYLFDDMTLGICRVCRDYTLTYFQRLGVVMMDDNPFIHELCIDSHVVPQAQFEYALSGVGRAVVIRSTRK